MTITANDMSGTVRRASELETFDKYYSKGQAQLKIKKYSRESNPNMKLKTKSNGNNNLIQIQSNMTDMSANNFFTSSRQIDEFQMQ